MKRQTKLDHIEKRLYTEPEAAAYLGKTMWGLREIRYKGKISFVQDGRSVLYDIRDLDKYIDDHKIVRPESLPLPA